MTSAHMYNLILTAGEKQLNGNFRSVIILCGFAALIMLIVAGKLFYDRVIGPKIDEFESGAPKKKKKKAKNTNKANTNSNTKNNKTEDTDDSDDGEDSFAFEYASIEDDDEATDKDTISKGDQE